MQDFFHQQYITDSHWKDLNISEHQQTPAAELEMHILEVFEVRGKKQWRWSEIIWPTFWGGVQIPGMNKLFNVSRWVVTSPCTLRIENNPSYIEMIVAGV